MSDKELVMKAADLVSAYVSHNEIKPEDLPRLLTDTLRALEIALEGVSLPQPAVPIEQSITKDYLVCLEDGERVVLLKRYLRDHHQMDPETYLAKWGLPEDYPMVAAGYSEKRSAIAKSQGLGKRVSSASE